MRMSAGRGRTSSARSPSTGATSSFRPCAGRVLPGRAYITRARLDTLVYREIGRRRTSGERGNDVLSLLLDARDDGGVGFTDRELRDHVMTLLFAGHDTTTSTVSFLFYELSRHPDVPDRLYSEVDALLGNRRPT